MLQISNLSFSYQGDPLFQNLNFSLSTPEIVAIIGDNGVGKTTLLNLIAGELSPDNGSIKYQGTLGFLHQSQSDLPQKSGGEQTQIRLSELFRQNPNILLLDEPTNNLDQESKAWLLRNLQNYRGLVLMVSHDRSLLEQTAQKIIYLHHQRAEIFFNTYQEFYLRQTQAQQLQLQNYERMQHQKKKLEHQLKNAHDQAHKSNRRSYNKIDDESRLRYNGQRTAAQTNAGKIIRATESKLAQISEITKPLERKTYLARVNTALSHDKKLLEVSNLSKSYNNKQLFQNLNFIIRTGERMRISGRNGSGKSTLFQIILGKIPADTGTVWLSPNLKIGYISQDAAQFNPRQSFLTQNPELNPTEIFHAASTMDLSPSDLKSPTEVLSRGQITKLAILKLILQPLDLVILDEITNHLDIRALENIENMLKNYQGAILAATHDQTFAEKINLTTTLNL